MTGQKVQVLVAGNQCIRPRSRTLGVGGRSRILRMSRDCLVVSLPVAEGAGWSIKTTTLPKLLFVQENPLTSNLCLKGNFKIFKFVDLF